MSDDTKTTIPTVTFILQGHKGYQWANCWTVEGHTSVTNNTVAVPTDSAGKVTVRVKNGAPNTASFKVDTGSRTLINPSDGPMSQTVDLGSDKSLALYETAVPERTPNPFTTLTLTKEGVYGDG